MSLPANEQNSSLGPIAAVGQSVQNKNTNIPPHIQPRADAVASLNLTQ